MVCFARSGGTVLNQCLGSLPGVVMMSEVNPLGGGSGKGPESYRTIKAQAKQWYNIDLKSDELDFTACTLELKDICDQKGKTLVIRDWSYINFIPDELNGYKPPYRLLSLEALQGKCEVVPFAMVRDAIDIWISFKSKRIRNYDADDFFDNYLKYIRYLIDHKIRILKYEDFSKDAEHVLREVCEMTGVPFSDRYKDYHKYHKLNGDIQYGYQSRGWRARHIRMFPRKIVSTSEKDYINRSKSLILANELMDYPAAYECVGRESVIDLLTDKIHYTTVGTFRKFINVFRDHSGER